MNGTGTLLAVALAVPVAMLLACLSGRMRARVPMLLALAPVPALVTAVLATGKAPLVLPDALLGATLSLDIPGAMLLGVAALLWIAAGTYAATYLRHERNAESFAMWWLLALTGNIGVFMAADIPSFYLFFAMGSLAAYGLIVHEGTPRVRQSGAVYVGFALLGEACVLMGLVLLAAAAPAGNFLIRDAVAALPASPWRDPTLALLIAGFALKIGLVPLHVWMPLTYSAAPIPAAAVLSGAAVKAGVIGLIRFMPFGAEIPHWGGVLVAVGLVSAYYGIAMGFMRSNPKTVLAYSSVSQMGLIAAVIGMGLATGNGTTPSAVGFYAAHHVLVKGALFLAIGVNAAAGARSRWRVLMPAAIIGLGLAGLPFTGGALAKVAVKSDLGEGIVGLLAALSAAGTTLLMLHFLRHLEATASQNAERATPNGLTLPWLALALASIAIPWLIYPYAVSGGFTGVLSLQTLWASLWPVLLGALIALGFPRWQQRLAQLPQGDLDLEMGGGLHAARCIGEAFERADGMLRLWPVAGISLLALAVVLGVAVAAGN